MNDAHRPQLSVLMPVFNELATVVTAIDRLEDAKVADSVELVIVDDGSTDGTRELITQRAEGAEWIRPVFHERNGGKGKAIRTALDHATGRLACIYDADLEYDPADMRKLLDPLLEGRAEAVYGVRLFGGTAAHSFWYVVGNRFVTLFNNVLFNCYLRDMMTCYKMMSLELFRSLDIRCTGFDLEAEITGKLLNRGIRVYEVPISYKARSHAEGKKLATSDAWGVLRVLLGLRFGRAGRRRSVASGGAGSDGLPRADRSSP